MESDSINGVKYTLRTKSLMKRIESERSRQGGKKREPKEKQKPPPLSKYRRKTANARERNRMKEINEAFETLQKTLPDLPGVDAEKLTKITVLRLAVNYIKILACVKDGDIIGTKDIDELRKLWCLNNAHMARPEHCVRPIFKASKITQSKSLKLLNQKPKTIKIKSMNMNKVVSDVTKEKTPPVKKKPSKSRTRGKVCKTASVATSNGAYITLKNVAFQCTPNRKGHLDNKPLMMSMTVKRPRLEHVSFKKPPKIARYNPPVVKPKIEKVTAPCKNIINYNPFSVPYNENLSPLLGNIPFDFIPLESPSSHQDKVLTNFTFYDLEGPVIKNDVVLEFPSNNLFTNNNIKDSRLRTDENSVPISPKSPSPFSFISNEELSPQNTRYSNVISSPCHSSDSDSILTPSIEFDSILGTEPFEEELDHLASSLAETDDSLTLFLDHHTSNFIC